MFSGPPINHTIVSDAVGTRSNNNRALQIIGNKDVTVLTARGRADATQTCVCCQLCRVSGLLNCIVEGQGRGGGGEGRGRRG